MSTPKRRKSIIHHRWAAASYRDELFGKLIATYEYFLQSIDAFVGYSQAINFPNLIAYVKCCLSVDHSPVHYSCNYASTVVSHFQSNTLQKFQPIPQQVYNKSTVLDGA